MWRWKSHCAPQDWKMDLPVGFHYQPHFPQCNINMATMKVKDGRREVLTNIISSPPLFRSISIVDGIRIDLKIRQPSTNNYMNHYINRIPALQTSMCYQTIILTINWPLIDHSLYLISENSCLIIPNHQVSSVNHSEPTIFIDFPPVINHWTEQHRQCTTLRGHVGGASSCGSWRRTTAGTTKRPRCAERSGGATLKGESMVG